MNGTRLTLAADHTPFPAEDAAGMKGIDAAMLTVIVDTPHNGPSGPASSQGAPNAPPPSG
eukprot:6316943-Heterocapsa_arctica.AAC.2